MVAGPSPTVVQLLGPSTGGIRAHVAELARRLSARGWHVVVAGPAGVMDGVGRQDAVVGVPVSWNPVHVRRARRQLAPLVHTAHVVHAHGLKAAAVALTVRPRPPLVLTVHNLVVGTQRGITRRLLGRLERRIIRAVDDVVVISPEIDRVVAELQPPDRRHVVLPVSPPRVRGETRHTVRARLGLTDDTPLVVVVARLHPQKDLPTFLAAMRLVIERVPTARAVVVGEGPERERLLAERDHLGLSAVVRFDGHRPNPVDEMAAADVVALSSIWEGAPIAVAECLSVGAPLVTTAVGTVTHHLVDVVSARIVPIGDAAAMADAIATLLLDRDMAAAIGAAGAAVAARTFDPDLLVDAVADVYDTARTRANADDEVGRAVS